MPERVKQRPNLLHLTMVRLLPETEGFNGEIFYSLREAAVGSSDGASVTMPDGGTRRSVTPPAPLTIASSPPVLDEATIIK